MDQLFQKNAVSPADANYVYDKRITFETVDSGSLSNDWDEEEEEDERTNSDPIDELFDGRWSIE